MDAGTLKKMIIGKFEQEALDNAEKWIAMSGRVGETFATREAAEARCEALSQIRNGARALLYAVGPVCGVETRATVASYTLRDGWEHATPAK